MKADNNTFDCKNAWRGLEKINHTLKDLAQELRDLNQQLKQIKFRIKEPQLGLNQSLVRLDKTLEPLESNYAANSPRYFPQQNSSETRVTLSP